MRHLWVVLHRWAGLFLALFLAIEGLTGAVLAFREDLDVFAAPTLHRVAPPHAGAATLDPLDLRRAVLRQFPGGTIDYLPLHAVRGRTVVLDIERVDPATGARSRWSRDWDELFVDPYTGRIVGYRLWGDIRQGTVNLVPFVYRIHQSLALDGTGLLFLGIVALVWAVDCFIGFYLTLPMRQARRISPARPQKNWQARWRAAWGVRWGSGAHKRTFDLHRAVGLWIWPLLLIFAWSAVSFNLAPVYRPIMGMFGYEALETGVTPPALPRYAPRIGFEMAVKTGERLAREAAARFAFTIDPARETGLLHRPDAGIYAYIFSTSADMRQTGGRSIVIFDSDTGRLVKTVMPQGQNGANSFHEWITALHMADVWGLAYRFAVSLFGLLLASLAVTGTLLWHRRRSARRASRRRDGGS